MLAIFVFPKPFFIKVIGTHICYDKKGSHRMTILISESLREGSVMDSNFNSIQSHYPIRHNADGRSQRHGIEYLNSLSIDHVSSFKSGNLAFFSSSKPYYVDPLRSRPALQVTFFFLPCADPKSNAFLFFSTASAQPWAVNRS